MASNRPRVARLAARRLVSLRPSEEEEEEEEEEAATACCARAAAATCLLLEWRWRRLEEEEEEERRRWPWGLAAACCRQRRVDRRSMPVLCGVVCVWVWWVLAWVRWVGWGGGFCCVGEPNRMSDAGMMRVLHSPTHTNTTTCTQPTHPPTHHLRLPPPSTQAQTSIHSAQARRQAHPIHVLGRIIVTF